MNKVKESVKTDTNENFSSINLEKQLEYLHHQLADLHLEKLLGPEASVDLSDTQEVLRKRLRSQLEAYSPASKPTTATPSKSKKCLEKASEGKASDHVTYELYYTPEQARFSNNSKLASIGTS